MAESVHQQRETKPSRGVESAVTESIEGPAPGEDSSVPPDPPLLPIENEALPTRRPAAGSKSVHQQRETKPSRGVESAVTESIEGPAPGEDSSVPPDPPPLPIENEALPTRRPAAGSKSVHQQRETKPSRGVESAVTESIEGPAPGEDSSVPPDPPGSRSTT